jgi:hypothetical protein
MLTINPTEFAADDQIINCEREAEHWREYAEWIDAQADDVPEFRAIDRIRACDVVGLAFKRGDEWDAVYDAIMAYAESCGYDPDEYYSRARDAAIGLMEERAHNRFVAGVKSGAIVLK